MVSNGTASPARVMYKALEEVPDECLVVFTDRDTLFNDRVERLQKLFNEHGSRIVMSAEGNYWPPGDPSGYPGSPTTYRYANSGSYAGRAVDVRELLYIMLTLAKERLGTAYESVDDQALAHEVIRRQLYNISLDKHVNFFQTMCMNEAGGHAPEQEVIVIEKYIVNVNTHRRPFLLHFNGHVVKAKMLEWSQLIPSPTPEDKVAGSVFLGSETQHTSYYAICDEDRHLNNS